MKFTKGMILGGIIATGAWMMYKENDTKKKMKKRGKQIMKKIGNW